MEDGGPLTGGPVNPYHVEGRGTACDPRSCLAGCFIPGTPCMRVPRSKIDAYIHTHIHTHTYIHTCLFLSASVLGRGIELKLKPQVNNFRTIPGVTRTVTRLLYLKSSTVTRTGRFRFSRTGTYGVRVSDWYFPTTVVSTAKSLLNSHTR